jgi:mannitol-1-phosphate/altronate dehydrogenase
MDMSWQPALPAVLPCDYDRRTVTPGIVHFGTGRRFRTAIAPLVDRILAMGHLEWGIVAVSQSDGPIHQALAANDGSYVLVEAHGRMLTRRSIHAIHRLLHARRDGEAIVAAIADPRTQLITVAIGESAYRLIAAGPDGRHDVSAAAGATGQDLATDPIGQIVAGLAARRDAGSGGLTILACDNLDQNNVILASLIDEAAVAHDVSFADWIAAHIRFPAVFGDRFLIDNLPAASAIGGADVAVEPFAQWVLEDNLGPERAPLAAIGASFVAEARPFQKFRRRLLEGGLLLLALCGQLRGHERLDRAVADSDICMLLDSYFVETAGALPPLKGFDPERYCSELIRRFANPALNLQLAGLLCDGSVQIREIILPTIADALRLGRSAEPAAAVVAAWMLHCTSGDVEDPHAECLTAIARLAGADWHKLTALMCDYEPVFGNLGRKPPFREMIERAVRLLPGLHAL